MKRFSVKRSAALSRNPLICCTRNGHLKADQMWWEKDIYICIYVFLTPEINEPERRMSPPAAVPQAERECCEALTQVQCFKEWQGGGDWLILQKKEKTCQSEEVNCSLCSSFSFFFFFAVFLRSLFFFTCCGLTLLLALRFWSFWSWNEVSTLMTINSLQQLFFIAVTFLLLSFHCYWRIWDTCFPWQFGKLACHRMYHMGKPSCWELYRSYSRSLCWYCSWKMTLQVKYINHALLRGVISGVRVGRVGG